MLGLILGVTLFAHTHIDLSGLNDEIEKGSTSPIMEILYHIDDELRDLKTSTTDIQRFIKEVQEYLGDDLARSSLPQDLISRPENEDSVELLPGPTERALGHRSWGS